MIYRITRFYFKKIFWFYYQKVTVIGKENIPDNTPVILALNHPNSLMDALIVAVNIKEPINSLTRGDAFKNKTVAKILRTYYMIPVYRISEGKENLNKNSDAFNACESVLQHNRTVLIFAEGLCENNWQLRPFKKGVARLAQMAWNQNDTSRTVVIPVGLTYQHYKGAGKSLILNFGKPLTKESFAEAFNQPKFFAEFNAQLSSSIESLIYKNDDMVDGSDFNKKFISNWNALEKKVKGENLFLKIKQGFDETKILPSKKIIPSAFHGSVIFLPHFWLMLLITKKLTKGTVFHDSVLYGLLALLLPFYLITLVVIIFLILHFF